MQPLHTDPAFLVYDKPAGLLAVPGRGADKQDCLLARAQHTFPEARVVHRLDMATSGLMVLARDASAQRALSRAFADRHVGKRYIAQVSGQIEAGPGTWSVIDLPIAADWPRRPLRVIDPTNGKPSRTRWRLLWIDPASDSSRLELEPVTGRTHQLRVHLNAVGHPILGDALYGDEALQARAPRLLLHASWLEFPHPVTQHRCTFGSGVPF